MKAEFFFPAGRELFLRNLDKSILPKSKEGQEEEFAKMKIQLVCVPQADGTFHINFVDVWKQERPLPQVVTAEELMTDLKAAMAKSKAAVHQHVLEESRSFSIKIKFTKKEVGDLLHQLSYYMFMLANKDAKKKC